MEAENAGNVPSVNVKNNLNNCCYTVKLFEYQWCVWFSKNAVWSTLSQISFAGSTCLPLPPPPPPPPPSTVFWALIILDLVLNSRSYFIANVGTVSNWKETSIYWFCHKGFSLKTSLFKASSGFPYVSRLKESSLLGKHWLPCFQAVRICLLLSTNSSLCLGVLKIIVFSQSRSFNQNSVPIFKGLELLFVLLTRFGAVSY